MDRSRITVKTARTVSAMYDRLSMQPAPESITAARTRLWASRKGFAPPLAWDDETIDDPMAEPAGLLTRDPNELDHVRVRRACAGKFVPDLTRAERYALAAWLVTSGRTYKETAQRAHVSRETSHRLLTASGGAA